MNHSIHHHHSSLYYTLHFLYFPIFIISQSFQDHLYQGKSALLVIIMVSTLYCHMLKLNEKWVEQYKGDLPANFIIDSCSNSSMKEKRKTCFGFLVCFLEKAEDLLVYETIIQ